MKKDDDLVLLRWKGAALGCLQEAGEAYMVGEYVNIVNCHVIQSQISVLSLSNFFSYFNV